ncbi:aspartate-alanine antiporter [Burkholderia sp. SFA1]|uniref:aspartate-alanine antiporter n=1 Tax=unclassified Caballeronia TaxID=2646786 RepID=UPI001F15DCA3|nr:MULTISPECIES: aspartate-alanine antiporter [unclassified Caballeronia]MCE4544001.1 aspartate-alanine antiporter [Caballeronia sp. PC1]MCE4571152.1 aspartate-alanine antiporter [Caballeronia sp. CLC5]BBP98931.1 aspartate-alanine antiporter [Burkholderia sp. SFA1]
MLWHLLAAQPEIALFASLAIGFLIGSFKLGPIQLGGVCGTLIVALILGQSGARISPDLKNIAFALFIFALGFTGGPQFFANIGKGWRYGALSVVEVVVVVTLVLCAVKLLRLDAGTAAGLLAGGATESAVIGTASEAIGRLGLDAAETARLQANIVTAYSVSYLFGLVTIVLFASQFAPLILRVNLREESERVWRKLGGDGALAEGQTLAMPPLVSRELKVTAAAGRSLGELEKQFGQNISVQRVLRDRSVIKAQPSLVLKAGDRVLVGGRREALVAAIPVIGEEVGGGGLPDVYVERVDVMLTRPELHGLTLAQARARVAPQEGRGVFVAAVTRLDSTIPALPGTQVHRGDVLTLVGNKEDVARGASKLGYIIRATQKTDFVFLGLGVLLGIAVGRLSVRAGGIDLTLGTGGGCLLAGLLFGWIRSRYPLIGSLPSAAAQILKDFGLCTFIAAVGLSAGADALRLIREFGIALPLAGIVITLGPALASLVIGRWLLKLDVPMLLGAIAGQQCSTPAISALVGVTGNATPVIGYTITYALSNVLLPLLGPLVVGLASKMG